VIIPVAISMLITGTLLVMETGGMRRFEELWLALAFVLYVIALLVVFLLQRPALNQIIALTESPPGPEGPPAELAENVRKMQLYGIILLVLTIVIVGLMVWKPVI
jgi:Mn2+/Fe2+ NRAMP family transporter